jgi:RNA recognition motif-containing protein
MTTHTFAPLHALRELQQCSNAETLTPAIHGLCSYFGVVEKLVILTARHEGTKQAICFLRLASEDQERALMQTLGVGKFGGEVVIVVDLKPIEQKPEYHNNFYWRSEHSSTDMAFRAA